MIRRGFTIVELIVAMALTSLLGLMAYTLFGISADNLVEVDSLEATASKGRFAIEKMRTMFQVAGSFSSPDSVGDPSVQPRSTAIVMRVAGFQSYTNWQGANGSSALNAPASSGRPDTSFDGIILTGAFDFPTSFSAGGIVTDGAPMVIPGNFLGMEKLNRVDPFSDVQPRNAGVYFPNLEMQDWSDVKNYQFLEANLASRLIRITDGLGYVQFLQPNVPGNFTFLSTNIINMNTGGSRVLNGVQIPLEQSTTFRPTFKGDNINIIGDLDMREIGIDKTGQGEGDRTYDASFIDTYWLHVISADDAQDPTNNLLILERLCAGTLATDSPDQGIRNPTASTPAVAACGANSRKLIADKVVDFQIWFDCAEDGGNGQMANNANWTQEWLTPGGTTIGGDCMNPGPTYSPGLARVAHARVTLRTDEERKNFSNRQFIDGENFCNNSAACPTTTLRSFDINPGLEGAAPVITFQTDIALRNFIIKDIR